MRGGAKLMALTVTNLALVGLTLAAAVGSWLAIVELRMAMAGRGERVALADRPAAKRRAKGPGAAGNRWVSGLVVLVGAGSAGLLGGRMATSETAWNPLVAHVDGLLLIAALLAVIGWFVQRRPKLAGMAAFYLPLLTLILAWAVCASAWTYRPFGVDTLHPVWQAVHLAGVYLGTLGSAVAAVAGAMYLFVERQFKAKRNPTALMRVASLERLERLIVQSATLGFALLTLGLVSGVVILWDRADLDAGWWASPKVLLATAAWAVYAVVMNVRTATMFRGRRAAWLAIGGLVLLLGVYGLVTAGDGGKSGDAPNGGIGGGEGGVEAVQRQDAKTPRRQGRQVNQKVEVGQNVEVGVEANLQIVSFHQSQSLTISNLNVNQLKTKYALSPCLGWRLGVSASWRLTQSRETRYPATPNPECGVA